MTGFRPGTSPPPVRMAILSFAGTGISLLAIFFPDAQKIRCLLTSGQSACPGLPKALRLNGQPELQVLSREARGTRQILSGGSTVKAAARPPHSKLAV